VKRESCGYGLVFTLTLTAGYAFLRGLRLPHHLLLLTTRTRAILLTANLPVYTEPLILQSKGYAIM
jgi:hypothetical protein